MKYTIKKVPAEAVKSIANFVLLDEDGASVWTPQGHYWGAYDESGLCVAFAGLKNSEVWKSTCYFHCAGVLPSARGRHLQQRLIRARLRWVKRNGYQFAVTYTMVDNPASSRSLIACGFKPYWPSIPWAGRSSYWIKRIG